MDPILTACRAGAEVFFAFRRSDAVPAVVWITMVAATVARLGLCMCMCIRPDSFYRSCRGRTSKNLAALSDAGLSNGLCLWVVFFCSRPASRSRPGVANHVFHTSHTAPSATTTYTLCSSLQGYWPLTTSSRKINHHPPYGTSRVASNTKNQDPIPACCATFRNCSQSIPSHAADSPRQGP
jgi:hypothetical protein